MRLIEAHRTRTSRDGCEIGLTEHLGSGDSIVRAAGESPVPGEFEIEHAIMGLVGSQQSIGSGNRHAIRRRHGLAARVGDGREEAGLTYNQIGLGHLSRRCGKRGREAQHAAVAGIGDVKSAVRIHCDSFGSAQARVIRLCAVSGGIIAERGGAIRLANHQIRRVTHIQAAHVFIAQDAVVSRIGDIEMRNAAGGIDGYAGVRYLLVVRGRP